MLKDVLTTSFLLIAYLCMLIGFHRVGMNEEPNIIISSLIFGLSLKQWVQSFFFHWFCIALISILCIALNDLVMLLFFCFSMLVGMYVLHYPLICMKKFPEEKQATAGVYIKK
ncbi:MAG: hypothetical protein Q4F77_08470 [Acinetobacter sp.]|uniref:hypothetical protein n=1 Tax=Acinetobacter sp. TaxID=472 RepID=UPI0026DF372F|nr:hypothetical protein [Acinetobacter sp.]MDO5543329.1 hypothetical protein [Acinetobacter sp.]